jgi:UDP-N-acetylenolpyruvoylglucosamine reductase
VVKVHIYSPVKRLIKAEIQEQVWRVHGVALEREVVFLPEDLL